MQSALLNKVPQVTLVFWVIKILATTVGETGADFLNFNLHIGLANTSYLMTLFLIGALFLQIRQQRYIPWIYWLAVVFISVVGTLITDNLTDNFNVPLKVTTGVFTIALCATFSIWYAREKTLSIHTIVTRKRELFYWLAILLTFALGTAGGDLVAEDYGLGYLTSALIFGGLIAAVTVAFYVLKMNATACFWVAYILTRPFGASCGDLLSQPEKYGGLGLGTISTSAVFLIVIVGLVIFLTVRDQKEKFKP